MIKTFNMKNNQTKGVIMVKKIVFCTLAVLIALLFMHCAGSKPETITVDNPKYENDKNFIRAYQFDRGNDKMLASQNARFSATLVLAQKIKSVVSSARTDQYLQDIAKDKIQDYRRIITTAANRIEKITIPDINDVTQTWTQQKDGSWECFIVIEAPRRVIKEAILADLENQKEIKTEEEKEAFKKVFDKIFEYEE